MYNIERSDHFPALSWAFDWTLSDNHITLYAGDGVETFTHGWVEGAWAGAFDEFCFHDHLLAGSGCRLEGESILIVPPFHTYEHLWVVEKDGKVFGANSLAFVLNVAGGRLSPDYAFYAERLASVVKGESNFKIELPIIGGGRLYALFVTQFRYHRHTGLSKLPVIPSKKFHDYKTYMELLNNTISSVVENAKSVSRRFAFEPVASLSAGYDTTAAACFAKKNGAVAAYSIADSRGMGNSNGDDDSGSAVADVLGLDLTSFPRETKLDVDGEFAITEFWATGGSCSEYPLRPLCESVERKILFTGYCGDLYYLTDRESSFQRTDLGGGSLGEIRKRVGFIHLPIPFIGVDQQKTLLNVSLSDEMQQWFTGRLYEKPIPRRIADESGIHHAMFGQSKQSIGSIENRYSIENPKLKAAVERHFREISTPIWGQRWYFFSEVRRIAERYVFKLLNKLGVVSSGHDKVNSKVPKISLSDVRNDYETVENLSDFRIRNRTLHGWMGGKAFIWAVEKLMSERYSLDHCMLPKEKKNG